MPERGIAHSLIRRILASSHYFIAFAVLGSFLSTVVLMVFSTLLVANITLDAIFNKRVERGDSGRPGRAGRDAASG
jgi:hypothetical protein